MGWRSHLAAIFGPENWTLEDGRVSPIAAPKPRLAAVTRAPSREAFLAWREHPVTLFAFAALARASKEQEVSWSRQSWNGGIADQILLNELRVRADAYRSMEEADYLGFCEWAGVEPKDGENSTA